MNKTPTCVDCGKKVSAPKHKRCSPCSKRYQKQRDSAEHPSFKTGKTMSGNGYVMVLSKEHPHAMKNGRVYEHRLVIEKTIGRFLKIEEHVHHINGITTDNRPENLIVTNAHDHGRFHTKWTTCMVCGKAPNKSTGLKRGLCSNHYRKWRRRNPTGRKRCTKCTNVHYAKGLCEKHYDQYKR